MSRAACLTRTPHASKSGLSRVDPSVVGAHQLCHGVGFGAGEQEADSEGVERHAVAESGAGGKFVCGARDGGEEQQDRAFPKARAGVEEGTKGGSMEADEALAATDGQEEALRCKEEHSREPFNRPVFLQSKRTDKVPV